jgi:hypothetical protein
MPATITVNPNTLQLINDAIALRLKKPGIDLPKNHRADLQQIQAGFEEILVRAAWHQQIYRCWRADGSVALVRLDHEAAQRQAGALPENASLQYSFAAASYEEAMAIHYLRQGFSAYQPVGPAVPCPQCGALRYTAGSGECWQCGLAG